MTEIRMTLLDVDKAIHDHFADLQIDAVDVECFIEMPDLEEVPERKYPSIAITPLGVFPDLMRLDTEEQEELSYDPVPDPSQRTMTDARMPYRAVYQVKTFVLDKPEEERQLIEKVVNKLPNGRGVILVESILDPTKEESVWAIVKSHLSANESSGEHRVFSKVWSIDLLITLAPINEVVYKTVKEADWSLYAMYRNGSKSLFERLVIV